MHLLRPLVFTIVLFPIAAQAAVLDFGDLRKAGQPRIPYGEVITLHGGVDDFNKEGNKYSEWMELADLIATAKTGTTANTIQARISEDRREWEFDLDALPAKSLLRIDMKATLRPSKEGAKKVAEKALQGEKFQSAVAKFFSTAKASTVTKAEDGFLDEIGSILTGTFPEFLGIEQIQLKTQPAVREKLVPLLNLRQNLKDLKGVMGVTADTTPVAAYELVKSGKAEKPSDETARLQYVAAYESASGALKGALVESVRQTVTISFSVPTSTVSTSDLQKYAGIDYAAVYVPNNEELRQFVMANIYLGAVDDSPLDTNYRWWQNRLSLSVGWCVGDLSNNKSTDIDGNNAFALGIGFRMNKYFRLSAGSVQYRSKADGTLRGDPFFGISIDVTAFDALKGLVSK